MQSPLFLLVLFGLLGFSNAGLRHAYDNIAAFLGYRAELLLLPEAERIIGVKCAAADPATLKCLDKNPKYIHCKGTAKSKTFEGTKIKTACTLREFLSHISGGKQHLKTDPLEGELKNYRDKRVLGTLGESAVFFDVDQAAEQMVLEDAGAKKADNWWCKVKDGGKNYEDGVTRLGTRFAELKSRATSAEAGDMDRLFTEVENSLNGLVTDRRCDMSEYLIPQLEAKGVKPLVIEPVSGTRRLFKEADTRRAIQQSLANHADAENEIKKALDSLDGVIKSFFNGEKQAKHKRVADLWESFIPQQAEVEGCSPRSE